MNTQESFMNRCLQLAVNGSQTASPNPLVGSVIVHNNKIIGEGWHQSAGKPHAEINAINSVKNKALLPQSTLYVNLEPCSHFGKTPPCSHSIVEHNIPKVIVGCLDISKKVNGKGIEYLKKNSVEVKTGILEEKCIELNRRFFTYHKSKRPFVILKWAETKNNYFDIQRNEGQTGQFTITNKLAQQKSHQLRASEDAIVVGKNTLLNDNPKLDSRYWDNTNPLRVFFGNNIDSSLIDNQLNTILFSTTTKPNELHDEIPILLKDLYKKEYQSIIIEGGKKTINYFLKNNIWDEIHCFQSQSSIIQDGVKAPTIPINSVLISATRFHDTNLKIYRNEH